MTFNPIAAQNVVQCKKIIKHPEPIAIDLGSQTPTLSNDFLDFMIKNNNFLDPFQIDMINKLKKKNNFITKDFFKSVGFLDYFSIDINGAYDSYKFDLNKDISQTYKFDTEFDLVINNGTGEHVFNQHSVFLNMHNISKKNGLMLNILPFIDWINHGFYNFNPIFFADLAASNSYEILKISLANRNGAEIELKDLNQNIMFEQIKPYKEKSKFKELLNFAQEKLGKNILLVVIMKKLLNKNFEIPLQGKYLEDISDSNIGYDDQGPGSANAENQISDNVKRNKK
jgi:hypothetical protein